MTMTLPDIDIPSEYVSPDGRLCLRAGEWPDERGVMQLPHLGSGMDRRAYALDESTVLKVAHYAHTACANLNERRLFMQYAQDPTLGRYLAPIRAACTRGYWLVMQRAAVNNPYDLPPLELRQVAETLGLGDIYGSNAGRIGEQSVFIDYAY